MAELNLRVVKAAESVALIPMDPETASYLTKLKNGATLTGEFKRARNPRFHRKAFALLSYAYQCWEPPHNDVTPARKDFDAFRRQLTILAGYYDVVYKIDGKFEVIAKSLKYSAMDDH